MLINCHSYYSFHYGTLKPHEVLETAVAAGADAVALTDVNSTAACLDFLRRSAEFAIHPVVGVDFKRGTATQYVALARNNEGFRQINRHLSNQLMHGEAVPDAAPNLPDTYIIYPLAQAPNRKLRDNEYVGVGPADLLRLRLSRWLSQPHTLVALQPMSFRHKHDHNTHRLLRAIDKNCLLSRLPLHEQASERDLYQSCDALRQAFAQYPELVANAQRLLHSCHVNFEFGNYEVSHNRHNFLGSFQEDKERLRQLALQGLPYRYPHINDRVLQRLEMELDIIDQKKFFSYFLINHDIVSYATHKGYFHMGRGSGANSLVAYLIGITDVDPIELDLYFERFINPSRKTPPDFDIDFSWRDRDDVTRYIFERFPKAALLGSFSTFKDRSVHRELGKVLGLPAEEIDRLNSRHVDPNSLDQLSQLVMRYGDRIQNFPNHTTVHSSGILIPERDIQYYGATFLPPKGYATTQFDMYVSEDVGLHKFDILGQRGLGKIKDTIAIVQQNQGVAIDVHDIPRFKEDARVKDLLRTGDTIGAFYIESPAMRMLLTKLKADDYNRLVAASSIIRPGVSQSGMMREYILRFQDEGRRKAARAELPELYDILHDTFGVMVYQEDVLRVAHQFAGLTLEEADVLRRGMSWKFRERNEFATIQQQFFSNCAEKGHRVEVVQRIWDQILSFANFAFAKGHSASYAVESFQALYLKAYYPLEYMVATINNGGGFYSRQLYLHEARMQGATVHLPCINRSAAGVTIFGTQLYIGLAMVKDLDADMIKRLVLERERNGPYTDLRHVVARVAISLEQLCVLIRIGAFRNCGKDKKTLLWDAHYLLGRHQPEAPVPRLFDGGIKEFALPALWHHQLEDAYDEMELLGFPVSISPFDLINRNGLPTLTALQMRQMVGQTVEIIAHRVHVKTAITSTGQRMCFGTFTDIDGHWIDTVHFQTATAKYPFRGPGVYKLRGKVVVEFGYYSLDVSYMERLPTLNFESEEVSGGEAG